ncbi:MAG: response regulator [Phycisphaerales bacterium]|nr:response regulator [Phycisphaerales bacterium]
MNQAAQPETTPELRSLRRRLIGVLIAFAVGIAGFEVIQSNLIRRSTRESEAVNIATRHQLLSQQIVKAAAMLEHANHADDEAVGEPFRVELAAAAETFVRERKEMLGPGASLTRSVLTGDELATLEQAGEAFVQALQSATKALRQDVADPKRDSRLMQLASAQGRYARDAEAVAERLSRSAQSHASEAMWVVLGAGVIFAGILVGVGMMLVAPSLRWVSEEMVRARSEGERALSSARQKEAMLERVSHGIRSPMMSVLGYSDMLLEPSLTTTERAEIAHNIRRSTKHLLALVHEVIDQAAVGGGRLAVGRVPCSPEQAVHEVVTMLRPLATTRKLALSEQIESSLPHAVIGDPIRLRQVLLQVIGNAIKFTPNGEIVVRAKGDPNDPERALIEVRDSGRGMSAKQLAQHGLTPETASAKLAGASTVGLPLARSLVLLMGGLLTAESSPGEGTTVRLSLAKAKSSPIAGQTRGSDVGVYPWLVGNVLVAEDNPDSQRLIAFYLRKMGLQSVIVPDGQQAVSNALLAVEVRNPFDMILMDMQMPSLDGYAATRELRQRGYKGVIVALTANALAGDREKCLEAGCDDYLTKPIERDVFVGTCTRLLCKGEDPSLRIAS